MVDAIRIQGTIVSVSRAEDGLREAVIAVNDDVGDGRPLHLRDLELDDYMQNPVVLYNHDRWSRLPIGQTASINWEPRGMVAKFRFLPGDDFAAEVQNAWDRGFLRAASIHATPIVEPGQPFGSATRYRLTEWSIVPVPADVDAVRSLDRLMAPTPPTNQPTPLTPSPVEPSDMDATQVADIVKRELDARDQESRRGAELKDTIVEVLRENGIIPAAAQDGADGEESRRAQGADAPPAAGDATPPAAGGDGSESEQDKIDKAVKERSEVLDLTRGLLPEGFDVAGKSNKDILVVACSDEVEDAATRSEDYLRAKLEGIKERRDLAGGNVSLVRSASAGTPVAGYQLSRPLDPVGMRRAVAQKGRAA